ncbi:MAG: TatD family hydrolase, partial [Burkholderiaceae bacterium]
VPLNRILIETDAPYLAPVPYRGQTNEPAYVVKVAEKLAELKDVAVAEVAARSTDNFYNLFKVVPNEAAATYLKSPLAAVSH